MAVISVPKPHQIGDLGQQDERRRLYTYLYQLSEKLESAMQNIDSENMSDAYNKQMTDITSVSEKAKQLAVMLDKNEIAETEKVRDMYAMLRDSVFSSVDNVTASFNTLVEQTDKAIRSHVEEKYIAVDADQTLEQKISSMIQQTAEQIRLEFSTIATMDVDTLTEMALNFKTYIRFSENGIEIGKVGDGASPIVTRLTNERLEFAISGTDVVLAYIENDKLYIDSAEIDNMSIGNPNDGYLDIDMQSTGLQIKWRDAISG